MSTLTRIVFSLLLPAFIQAQAAAQVIPPEAIQAWKSYEQAVRKLSAKFRLDTTHRDNGKVIYSVVTDHVVKSTANGIVLEETDGKENPRHPERQSWKLQVANRRYEFFGRRAPESTHWALAEITKPDMFRAMPKDRVTTRDEIEARYLLPALAVDNVLVDRLISHPSCQLTSGRHVVHDGRDHYELSFSIDAAKKIAKTRNLIGGTLLFDPANRWLLSASELRLKNGKGGVTTIRTKYRYGEGGQGTPLISESEFELESDDKTYTAVGKLTYEWLGPTNMKDGDFTLRAFGFPEQLKDIGMGLVTGEVTTEMPGTQTDPAAVRSGGWYLPVFFSVIGLIVIGLVARQLIARRRVRVAA